MKSIDILLTAQNHYTLPLALSGIAGQNTTCFRLIVADARSGKNVENDRTDSMLRIVQARCGTVDWEKVDPDSSQGERLDFLLSRATADLVLTLDDDVWLAPWALTVLCEVLAEDSAGFAGLAPVMLPDFVQDSPTTDLLEYWNEPVQAEAVAPDDPLWIQRSKQQAVELYQLGQQVVAGERRKYKVAWVDKCCLYDRNKLLEVGGFQFWHRLPNDHYGAPLIPQVLLLHKWGGSAVVPSGAYYIGAFQDINKAPTDDVVALLRKAIQSGSEEPDPEFLTAQSV